MKTQFATLLLLAFCSTPAMSTVVIETQRVTVDPASSHATLSSTQFVFDQYGQFGQVDSITSTRLAGTFDLVRTTYIWDDPSFVTPPDDPARETWLSFANVQLQALDAPVGVDLSISARLADDGSFSGDNGPCSSPQPPNTFCTGFSTGLLGSLGGVLLGNALTISGAIPVSFPFPAETVTFTINGLLAADVTPNTVALPGVGWLLLGGMLGIWRRAAR